MTQYKENISNNKYIVIKIIELGWNQNPYSKCYQFNK